MFAPVEDVVAAVAEVDDAVRELVLSLVLVDEEGLVDSLLEDSTLDAGFDFEVSVASREFAMIERMDPRSGLWLVDVGATVEVGLEEGFALLLDGSTSDAIGTDVLTTSGVLSNPLSANIME